MIEIAWDGKTITEPGIYTGISLEAYHNDLNLLDGPSVSKSGLKHILPSLGGSAKAFWHLWRHNPDHIVKEPTKALNMGKAVHCLMLGDEVFNEAFAVQPATYPDSKTGEPKPWNNNANHCKAWTEEQDGKTVITFEQIEKIKRMADDAAKHPLVQQGILNGVVERSMFWKDKATGIWLKVRPDNIAADGFYSDLKTTGSMDERFIRRSIRDNGYFLQAAGVRMVARELGLPFETFVNVYVSTADTPDTEVVELDQEDFDLGESVIRYGLDTISECMKSGQWPGARPFEGRTARLSDWDREAIERDLKTPQLEQAA